MCQETEQMNPDFQRFWSIEADGIQKDPEQVYTKQEEQFLDISKNSINHNGERSEIKLP